VDGYSTRFQSPHWIMARRRFRSQPGYPPNCCETWARVIERESPPVVDRPSVGAMGIPTAPPRCRGQTFAARGYQRCTAAGLGPSACPRGPAIHARTRRDGPPRRNRGVLSGSARSRIRRNAAAKRCPITQAHPRSPRRASACASTRSVARCCMSGGSPRSRSRRSSSTRIRGRAFSRTCQSIVRPCLTRPASGLHRLLPGLCSPVLRRGTPAWARGLRSAAPCGCGLAETARA